MNRLGVYEIGYRLGGAIALALGAAHFLLPTWGYEGTMLGSIPEVPRDHFVYLGTYAIGMFLLSSGVMSLHFAKVGGNPTARLFALLQMLFWAGRLVLELSFPSRVQIFFLAEPPMALSVVIVVAFASYAAAFIAAVKAPAASGTT